MVLVEDLYTPTSVHHGIPRIHQIKLGPSWTDSISLFLEKDILPEEKSEVEKVRRKLFGFGSPSIENYTSALSLAFTCFVCTPKHQNHFLRSFTKGFNKRKIPIS